MAYTIKELEHLSGVKAHTIRIWEQRYDLLEPMRTDTNIRRYDDEQCRKLLNVSVLYKAGWKISKIAKLEEEQMNAALGELQGDLAEDQVINQLVMASMNFDEQAFHHAFGQMLLRKPFGEAFPEIIYPLLEKLGWLWQSAELTPAQEHFCSQLLKQKLFAAIEACPPPSLSHKVVFFLPEHESHELGLLFVNYQFRAAGFAVVYLGPNVPVEALNRCIEELQPDLLMSFLTKVHPSEIVRSYIEMVQFKNIWLSGRKEFLDKCVPDNHGVKCLNTYQEFYESLKCLTNTCKS